MSQTTEMPPVAAPVAAPEGQPAQAPVVESATAADLFGGDDEPPLALSGSNIEHNQQPPVVPPVQPQQPVAAVTPPVQPPPVGTPAQPGAVPQQAPIELSAEQMAHAAKLLGITQPVAPVQQQAPAPAQQPQQLDYNSPQVRQALGVYDLSEADYDSVFLEQDKAKSMQNLNGILQKVALQAVTMANHLVQNGLQQVQQTVAPYMQYADNVREHELRNAFFTQHPDLQGQDQLLAFVQNQMRAEKVRYSSDQAAFDEVAKRTKALIASAAGRSIAAVPTQPAVPGAPAPVVTPPAGKPTMVQMSRGGAGGGEGQPSQNQNGSSTARSIFG